MPEVAYLRLPVVGDQRQGGRPPLFPCTYFILSLYMVFHRISSYIWCFLRVFHALRPRRRHYAKQTQKHRHEFAVFFPRGIDKSMQVYYNIVNLG